MAYHPPKGDYTMERLTPGDRKLVDTLPHKLPDVLGIL